MSNKKVLMWLCVGGVTAVIAVIWVASIRFSISASAVELKESKRQGLETFTELQTNFKKQIEEMKEKFEKLQATSTSEVSTSTNK